MNSHASILQNGIVAGLAILAITSMTSGARIASAQGTPFCFGDGSSGTNCPCLNGYATGGCKNSLGRGAVLQAIGAASLSSDTLVLSVSQTTNMIGMFCQGNIALSPPTVFGDGLLCCDVSVVQIGVYLPSAYQTDTDTGNLIAGFGSPISSHPGNSLLLPGDSRCYQWTYRDGNGPCNTTFNLSNAVQVTWAP